MQAQNLEEYSQIRNEMNIVKECITHYMGYVLGGSGVALFAFTSFANNNNSTVGIAYASLLFSLLISLVLLILFYKFNSHNRFAGYCKLLSQERFHPMTVPKGKNKSKLQDIYDLAAWETCMELLRQSEVDPGVLMAPIDKLELEDLTKDDLRWKLEYYVGDKIYQKGFWRGLEQLLIALRGRSKTNSWSFPPIITAVFFVLCLGFLALGAYKTLQFVYQSDPLVFQEIIIVIAAFAVFISEVLLWIVFLKKLHSLMIGNATVDGFFWRLLPLRAFFLNQHYIKPEYLDANRRLQIEKAKAVLPAPPMK